MENNRTYTFIGDVHGQAPTLLALLEKLGWRKNRGRPTPEAHNAVCLDYGAGREKHLVAYHWIGQKTPNAQGYLV